MTSENYNIPIKLQNRIDNLNNELAKNIIKLIFEKKTNVALSLDVNDKKEFLSILKNIAPHICILKTHINTINDFDIDFIQEIIKIQNQNKFYILEDGKFSDIGNTFKKQLTQGIFKINNWANSVTAHGIAGESIINTYENINADNINKGIIFVAEMSNKGNLITENYTNSIIDMCKHNKFITGFVTQKKISDDSYLYFTPGVSIQSNQDNMDQQYRTPKNAIVDNNCDIIIVGRGIYSHNNCIEKAIEYKLCSYPHFIKKYE